MAKYIDLLKEKLTHLLRIIFKLFDELFQIKEIFQFIKILLRLVISIFLLCTLPFLYISLKTKLLYERYSTKS